MSQMILSTIMGVEIQILAEYLDCNDWGLIQTYQLEMGGGIENVNVV